MFDRDAGHFKLHESAIGAAILSGEGTIASWTARGLERLGYRVQRDGQGVLQVDILEAGGRTVWVARRDGRMSRHHSIGELVSSIRSDSRPLASVGKQLSTIQLSATAEQC